MSRRSLAIIGAGSSGLIVLKNAIAQLPDWDVQCFEKGDSVRGCWGNPYPGFISTSTKFTTQFSTYRKYDDSVDLAGRQRYTEFFRDNEYGDYLEAFAAEFDLYRYISFRTRVTRVESSDKEWIVHSEKDELSRQTFSAVIVATGLAQKPRKLVADLPYVTDGSELESIKGKKIVVMGGGESAADIANRLARSDKDNKVYLSLRSGIRVSPRYHPIRGVPSDFLRNRLMLSITPGLRNAIGQKFVEARIRHREKFEKLFPARKKRLSASDPVEARRRFWDLELTRNAKGKLFDVFHNKSDGFLDAIGEERLKIIGPPLDGQPGTFYTFDREETIPMDADLIVPQLGYTTGLEELFRNEIKFQDFYLGCQHTTYANLFLVGFARPIIGNIPAISEQQAKYVIDTLSGEIARPSTIKEIHKRDRAYLEERFSRINTKRVYPVEMFPYCDSLALFRGTLPTIKKVGLKRWLKIQLSPATTMQYLDDEFDPYHIDKQKTYTPPILNGLLAIIKLLDQTKSKPTCE